MRLRKLRNRNMVQTKVKRHRQDFMNDEGVVVPTETTTHIYGLFGKYRALSNFHEEPVAIDGLVFQTSEAAYMSRKTHDPAEKFQLTLLAKGSDAKKYGQTVTLREDWEEVKVEEMYEVLLAKFTQSLPLRELLLSTGNKIIEETNWWGDIFWGVCGGIGQNQLGQCLMRVRDQLQ